MIFEGMGLVELIGVLYIRDANGKFMPIPAIKGKDGEPGASATVDYTGILYADLWTEGDGYYSQTVTITGILETDTPIVDIILSLNAESNKAITSAWGDVQRITTAADSITAYCFGNVPTVDIPIQLKVVR